MQKYVDNGYDPKLLGYKIVLDDVFAVKAADSTDDFAAFKYPFFSLASYPHTSQWSLLSILFASYFYVVSHRHPLFPLL